MVLPVMENICATFETWYIGEGTYSPLHKGQKVNLSFYIKPEKIRKSVKKEFYLKQTKYSDYLFCGEVICSYTEKNFSLLVIDTGHYKLFIERYRGKSSPSPGQFVKGKGQIILDYFIWAETLHEIDNAPDIYYNFIIERILQVTVPERFKFENDEISFSPTSLDSSEYTYYDVVEVQDMNGESGDFYLLELKQIDEEIPMT
jgi:hypothetical protein